MDTPFPFPWAQLLTLLMVLYVVALPFMMAAYLRDVALSTSLTFISCITYWATNEVCCSQTSEIYPLPPAPPPPAACLHALSNTYTILVAVFKSALLHLYQQQYDSR